MSNVVMVSPIAVGVIGSLVASVAETTVVEGVRLALLVLVIAALVLGWTWYLGWGSRLGSVIRWPRWLLVTAAATGVVMATATAVVTLAAAPLMATLFWLIVIGGYVAAWRVWVHQES